MQKVHVSFEKIKKVVDSLSENPENVTVSENSKSVVIKVKLSGDRREFLRILFKKLEKSNLIVELVNHSWLSRSSGHLKVDSVYVITKPLSGASENLSIYTSKLTQYGIREILDIIGFKKISCNVFYSLDNLIQSILKYFQESKLIHSGIIKTFSDYFEDLSTNEFFWNKKVNNSEKNELGKYFGEILLGILVFSNLIEDVSENSKFNKMIGNSDKIIYPISSNFKIVDAAFQKNNKIICISNKFGSGSSSSFFSNIFPYLEKKSGCREINRLLESKNKCEHLTYQEIQFGIIFDYGLKYILDIEVTCEPIEIYRKLISGKINNDVKKVISAIKKYTQENYCKSYDTMLKYLIGEHLYSSVTGFLCREISKRLNSDKKSLEYMNIVVGSKNFWQANLNIEDWNKGKVNYKIENSSNLKLVIVGDKSGYNDIKCSQGKINYVLTEK